MPWHPDAHTNPINHYPGINYTGSHPFRGVIHKTQVRGDYNPRIDGTYFGGASPPHATVAANGIFQHIDTRRGSYALVNSPGGVETNTDHVIQCEVMGMSEDGDIDEPTLVNLISWMRWVEVTHGVAYAFIPFHDRDDVWANRLTFTEWYEFEGWCGHQHVPENDHWDPGLIPTDRLFPVIEDTTKDKVLPMYSPPLGPIVASCAGPQGLGAICVGSDGGVFLFHVHMPIPEDSIISPVGQAYWEGRTPATVELTSDQAHYTITATNGDTYTFPYQP